MQSDELANTSDDTAVRLCGEAAQAAAPSIAAASDDQIKAALLAMGQSLAAARSEILAANAADIKAAERGGMAGALVDRLRLTEPRLADMGEQLRVLAETESPPASRVIRQMDADGGEGTELVLLERRRPVGVIGANFEARPPVTVDVASQLLKSRNAGVLRTGSAALRSAVALAERVIAPGMRSAGLDADAIQLIREPGRRTAQALVAQPGLIPLVILRGSGESTRALSRRAAEHGVRTLAHADGGGVLYIDRGADPDFAMEMIARSLDRLGVCNRLNLLLLDEAIDAQLRPRVLATLEKLGVTASLPPHSHPRGHEWALDSGNESNVTFDVVSGARAAAQVANAETSGLAAGIVTEDAAAAESFMEVYSGTGLFWNATTRLLDGFKLLRLPETGINVDHVPGPRGPVTFRDLYMRQFVVVPAAFAKQ